MVCTAAFLAEQRCVQCRLQSPLIALWSLICCSINPSSTNLMCYGGRCFSNERFNLRGRTWRHNLFCFQRYDRPQHPVLASLHTVSRLRLLANDLYCLSHLLVCQRCHCERSLRSFASDVHASPLIELVDQLAQVDYLDLHDGARLSSVVMYRKGPV